MLSAWKKKKRKTVKFVDAGSKNWSEKKKGIKNMKWIDKEKWRRKIK